ncbi:Crp/Fnr family transcriptional regulator [Paracoccus spongiarum]|uniref:Crp/Fnr family transcriptional regulator n=1 Tax=Paracoccus spongiarum TaxID=3064387 RepID=A0ABT9JAU7_9RHOB|nr:Crp/Fnr family transcriptional regulator [Paracoccus sp. 2205BS29-5]MDP5306951.1 Crp/Fnr family transcriptional regulator [Paracoccus sp. 2205BS29-5]
MVDLLLRHDLPLLRGVRAEDLQGLDIRCHLSRLSAWETLFQQSDAAREVCFLVSGALMAIHWTEDGREIIFTRFQTGDHFGELAALDGGARSLAVVARDESQVLVLERDSFLRLIDRLPVVRDRLLQSLVARIRVLTQRNLELVTFSVEQRLRSYLVSIFFERGRLHPGGVIEDMPTHSEIAASIGANREIVSRVLSQLRRDGLIRTGRRRIELRDPGRLAGEAA